MRFARALLVTFAVGTTTLGLAGPAGAAAADASIMLQQPESQPQQPTAGSPEQDESEITSAGWANIIWIVVVLVLGVAFVWLAMAGLRARTRG
jgi:heme/copper-type cytochrome/quinol oxidase subunit 2